MLKIIFKVFLVISLLLYCRFSFSIPAAPNDYVIKEIKRLYHSPKTVVKELELKLKTTTTLKNKSEMLFVLSYGYMLFGQLDKAELAIEEGLNNIDSSFQPLIYYRLLLARSRLLGKQGNPSEGLRFARIVNIWAQSKGIIQLELGSMMTSSSLEWQVGQYMNSVVTLTDAYHLSRLIKTQISPAHLAGVLGEKHLELEDPMTAKPYLQEWLKFAQSRKNQVLEQRALFQLGIAHLMLESYDDGQRTLFESLYLAKLLNNIYAQGEAIVKISELFLLKGDIDLALSNLNRVKEFKNKIDSPKLLFEVEMLYARIYLLLNDISLSEKYLAQSINTIEGLSFNELEMQAADFEATLHFRKGNYLNAYEAKIKSSELERLILKNKNEQALSYLRVRFYTDFKESENLRLTKIGINQKEEIERKKKKSHYMLIFLTMLLLIIFLLIVVYLKHKKILRCLERSLNYDCLTRVYSRRKILLSLQENSTLVVEQNKFFTVAMLDLDHFKVINDTYGHIVGDEVLKSFSQLAKNQLDDVAQIGRLGGEEFLFIFPGIGLDETKKRLDEFRESLESISCDINAISGKHIITVSIGVLFVNCEMSESHILSSVDDLLYKAKDSGRNRIIS